MRARVLGILLVAIVLLTSSIARAYEVYWVDGYWKEVTVTETRWHYCGECLPVWTAETVTYKKLVWVDGYWAVRCEPYEDCPYSDPGTVSQ